MGKDEFLEELSSALSQELPREKVDGQLDYYKQYISGQISNGKPEQEVIASLGAPRLIAKTILDTAATTAEYTGGTYEKRQSYDSNRSQPDSQGTRQVRDNSNRTWIYLGIGIVVLFGVLAILASIVTALAPFILPIVIVALVLGYFRRKH